MKATSTPMHAASVGESWERVPKLAGPLAIALAGMDAGVRDAIDERAMQSGTETAVSDEDGIVFGGSVLIGSGHKPASGPPRQSAHRVGYSSAQQRWNHRVWPATVRQRVPTHRDPRSRYDRHLAAPDRGPPSRGSVHAPDAHLGELLDGRRLRCDLHRAGDERGAVRNEQWFVRGEGDCRPGPGTLLRSAERATVSGGCRPSRRRLAVASGPRTRAGAPAARFGRGRPEHSRTYGRASYTRLNGVSAARRKRVKPPAWTTSRIRASPACAPSASPTSWDSDAGVHSRVEKP